MGKLKIGFPQIGNYQYPAYFLFSNILNCEILKAPVISQKTVTLGCKYSPCFVCMPFKYTLGTMLEVIEMGANCVIQLGGGCRYGYYYELQKKIISDLGYDVKYINLITMGHADVKKIYGYLKSIDKSVSLVKCIYYLNIVVRMVKFMDSVDDYIRQNVGFEVSKGLMEKYNLMMLEEFLKVKNIWQLKRIYKKYFSLIKNVELVKPKNVLKVGVIGELYTVMEPFSNYFLEKELASYNISVKRFTCASYLLFEKKAYVKKNIKKYSKYVKYRMGADATDNIMRAVSLCHDSYDGIIHIKSTFCTPEIASMGIINKVCSDSNVPVMFLSFDSNTSKVGLQTRLEAFKDMIEMRKK